MNPRLFAALALAAALSLAGCFKSPSAVPAHACAQTADCASGTFCRRGTCQRGCQTNADCPAGLCHADGTCGTRPACTTDTDCPLTFACRAGVCACTTDYACWGGGSDGGGVDTSRICVSGACQASSACAGDADCTDGRYCGPAGVCTAPCVHDPDCGGSSQLGGALTCSNGRCTAPCLSDAAPVGQGGCPENQICTSGLCARAECQTAADCQDPTLYCTSAAHGHCQAIRTCDPSVPEACGPLSECAHYPASACPPGFDCSLAVCIDEPACLTDGQCGEGQICDLGGCKSAPACHANADCAGGDDCIGGHCLTHVCRGPGTCAAGLLCTGGVCAAPPDGGDVTQVRLLTPIPTLEVGQTEQLFAVALTAAELARPVAGFQWSVSDGGEASVSVSSAGATGGLLTALAPGPATVTVGFTRPDGAAATPDSASFNVVASPGDGGRVLVVDSQTGAPIAGALVRVCGRQADGGPCVASALTTDPSGAASFVPPGGAFDVSVADPAVEGGRPVHDVVHLLGLTATDVLVPLPRDPVGEAAGFTASIDFGQVSTQGEVHVGLAGSSFPDLASLSLLDLLGQQPWVAHAQVMLGGLPGLPGVGAGLPGLDGGTLTVPLTGATVAGVDGLGGLSVQVHIKDAVYALGSPGLRAGWAFAGRVSPQLFFGSYGSSLASGALGGVLPLFGAFDHGLRPLLDEPLLPQVLDAHDLDGDGVCEDPAACATSGERLPDYAHFPSRIFTPAQAQSLRVALTAPAGPTGTAQLLLLAGAQIPGAGLLPLGLSATAAAPDTHQEVLRMAPLYGGFEAVGYAVLALAQGANGALSASIARASALPQEVDLGAPMLPFVSGAHYDPASRTLTAPADLGALAQATQLIRVAVVGGTQRAFVYASPAALAAGIHLPPAPGSSSDPASDPAAQATLAAYQLSLGDDLDGLASLPGPTLLDLSKRTVRFSRALAQ